jgi:hypothetical protein
VYSIDLGSPNLNHHELFHTLVPLKFVDFDNNRFFRLTPKKFFNIDFGSDREKFLKNVFSRLGHIDKG